MITSKTYTDEHDLSEELQVEDVVIGRTSRASAFVDLDDEEYDWVPVR